MLSPMYVLLLVVACTPFASALDGVRVAAATTGGSVNASAPVVDLGYAQYRGVRRDAGVDEYLGMRNPVYKKRQNPATAAAENPTTVQLSNLCIGVGQDIVKRNLTAGLLGLSEDCLTANVWTPSNRTSGAKLPVWLFIQGGGYATISASFNGTKVVEQSGGSILFVSFNYRVGALGFLAGEKVRADGHLNAGLLDQRKAMHWVQDNIAKFGGDPDHVVLYGPSAGAGAVAHHMTAYDGRDDNLFIGAILESSFWPTLRTVADSEEQFNKFVFDTDCYIADDALACLRSTPLEFIQVANRDIAFPGAGGTLRPLYYWLPVVEGPGTLVPDGLYRLFAAGSFVRVPLLLGNDNDEGTVFASNASTAAQVSTFLKANFPKLTREQLRLINDAYPLREPMGQRPQYFPSLAAAYGESTLVCPSNNIAEAMAMTLGYDQVWNYRVNVRDPGYIADGLGTPHVAEQVAIFGPGFTGREYQASWDTTNAAIVPVFMMYWISFIRSLNPNTYKYGSAPEWDTWGDLGSGLGRRLKLQTNDTVMEEVPQEQADICAFWGRLSNSTEQ